MWAVVDPSGYEGADVRVFTSEEAARAWADENIVGRVEEYAAIVVPVLNWPPDEEDDPDWERLERKAVMDLAMENNPDLAFTAADMEDY